MKNILLFFLLACNINFAINSSDLYNQDLERLYKDLFGTHMRYENSRNNIMMWIIWGRNACNPWGGEPKLMPFNKRAVLILQDAFLKCAKLYNVSAQQFFADIEKLSQQILAEKQKQQSLWSQYIITSKEINAAKNLCNKLSENKKFIERNFEAKTELPQRFYKN